MIFYPCTIEPLETFSYYVHTFSTMFLFLLCHCRFPVENAFGGKNITELLFLNRRLLDFWIHFYWMLFLTEWYRICKLFLWIFETRIKTKLRVETSNYKEDSKGGCTRATFWLLSGIPATEILHTADISTILRRSQCWLATQIKPGYCRKQFKSIWVHSNDYIKYMSFFNRV